MKQYIKSNEIRKPGGTGVAEDPEIGAEEAVSTFMFWFGVTFPIEGRVEAERASTKFSDSNTR